MTSPIDAISAVSGVGGISGIDGLSAASGTPAVTGPNSDFAGMLANGLESVQASQNKANDLAVQVANGTLSDPAQYTMAANDAALAMQLTVAIRNKAVEAFQEIMRMQA
ncbi:flagellar hook-basal body complex protein FliE [Krasilnikovia cinnamomea]|uniref:Flagellar hook-basal body complex protein FliE n=1 Tax=Krasilnikovia cinnamomea TaxID=349313 RepID=A0A4Q7ZIY9_9ACTN|nr:flagellar hook-basal body complex protein FliE [Krasilnikovia cinnamomea]RZU50454.1 flagellar hook-basal body complex protein FliE [Krasilnikovia cinnamomea]